MSSSKDLEFKVKDSNQQEKSLDSVQFVESLGDDDEIAEDTSKQHSHRHRHRKHHSHKSETVRSLQESGVDRQPSIDVNFPITEDPNKVIFPDEYNVETETGLVPSAAIREYRKNNLPENEDLESGLEKHYDYVTFKVNDPENPKNWSKGYKWYVTIIMAILVCAVAFGSSNVTGGLGLIVEKYNVSMEVAILSCSLMVIGFMVGPLLWSPLSEQIGRRPVYIGSLLIYIILNIPLALSPNIAGFLIVRFLCGVFSSSGLVLAGGTIADIWDTRDRGNAIAYFAAAPYGGPVLGPLICGWINVGTGRLDLFFYVTIAFTGAILIPVALIPETYPPVILKTRAARLRKETGDDSIITEQEQNKPTLKEIIRTCLLRPVDMMLSEPVLDCMNIYVVLIYALLYAFFFAYPVIFGELYGFNDGFIGLMLIPILIGTAFALCTTPYLEKMYRDICDQRTPTPEDRLLGAMIGAPFIPIALFILGSTSHEGIIWVGPASSGLAFGYGMVLIYFSVNNYIIDSYVKYAASALAAKVFTRSAGGAAFPLFITQMYHGLGNLWASFLLAFVSLAMVLIPFGFYFYGARLRAKFNSKYA